MNQKETIIKFIQGVSSNNFKEAHAHLTAVVNEKIKARIAAANMKLTNSK